MDKMSHNTTNFTKFNTTLVALLPNTIRAQKKHRLPLADKELKKYITISRE
jgi:hypothetical protein